MAPGQVVDDMDVEMEVDESVEQEEKVINEEYKTWKKNSPFLYDMILSTALEWPTLTTQWFPDVKEPEGKNYRVHRLLLGTHTAPGAQNYLQIAEVEIPKPVEPNASDYDDTRGEIGGYGREVAAIKMKVVQKIEHPSEVNKARYQPQNPDLIATLCVDGRILIYNRTKHQSGINQNQISSSVAATPDIELIGHTKEGFGLNWSPHEEGWLASGSEDSTVCIW